MSTSLWRTQRGPCSTWAYQSGGPTFWSSMPRPTARATATLRLRTSSSSRATAPLPTKNSQLTSNGYSAEHENLAYRGGVASLPPPSEKSLSPATQFPKYKPSRQVVNRDSTPRMSLFAFAQGETPAVCLRQTGRIVLDCGHARCLPSQPRRNHRGRDGSLGPGRLEGGALRVRGRCASGRVARDLIWTWSSPVVAR